MFPMGSFKTIHKYNVKPKLPKELEFLLTISYNLWFVWDRDAVDLFRRIDRDLWDEMQHGMK